MNWCVRHTMQWCPLCFCTLKRREEYIWDVRNVKWVEKHVLWVLSSVLLIKTAVSHCGPWTLQIISIGLSGIQKKVLEDCDNAQAIKYLALGPKKQPWKMWWRIKNWYLNWQILVNCFFFCHYTTTVSIIKFRFIARVSWSVLVGRFRYLLHCIFCCILVFKCHS